jgi:hypothetical protein
MHDNKPEFDLVDTALLILDVHRAEDTLPPPAARRLLGRATGFFQ